MTCRKSILSMIRCHFVGGIILLLIGVYFLLGGLSWLPENSQAMVWPLALIIAGVLLIFKSRRRGPWSHSHMAHHRKEWMKRRGLGMNFKEEQQQCESVDGFLHSENVWITATEESITFEYYFPIGRNINLNSSPATVQIDISFSQRNMGMTQINNCTPERSTNKH